MTYSIAAKGTEHTFTITNGADGSAVTPVTFERNYKAILVTCTDCQYIAATTNLTAQIAGEGGNTMCDLYEIDDPGTQWSKGSLPTSGTLAFVLTHAFATRQLRLILSNNASGGSVVFTVQGMDGLD